MGPSKQLKQMIQIENIIVKNPNWLEANQLAFYKRGRGFEPEGGGGGGTRYILGRGGVARPLTP